MASYFRQVPNFDYVSRNPGDKYISEYIPVKNLFKRGKLREDIFGNLQFFEKYSIIGDERPDNVAFKIYDDETLDWVVLLSNNILNIQTEWPMPQRIFDKVMLDRYGSYDNLYNGIHHYETNEIKNSLGITVLSSGLGISPTWKTNGNFIEIINSKIKDIISDDRDVFVFLENGILGLEVGSNIIIDNVSEPQYNGEQIIKEIISTTDGITVNGFIYELPSIPNVSKPVLAEPRKEEVLFKIPEKNYILIIARENQNIIPLEIEPDLIEIFVNERQLLDDEYESTGNLIVIKIKISKNDYIKIASKKSLFEPNSYYYEYWDSGLGSSVLVPSTSFVRPITNYEYENQLQEDKRNIYILKPRYLNIIFDDLQELMTYKKGSTQYISGTLKRGDNIRLYT